MLDKLNVIYKKLYKADSLPSMAYRLKKINA